ncbi:MAG: hypothetical protein J4F50_02325 [Acidimicrobiia bacterium]|nr:hypothetical protein [Acidimicrobiia bacterium]
MLAAFDSLPGRVHFIAHAIREIGNRLPVALGNKVKKKTAGYEDHAKAIRDRWLDEGLPPDGRLRFLQESAPSASGPLRQEVSVGLLASVGKLIAEHRKAEANREARERAKFGALSDLGSNPSYVIKNWGRWAREAVEFVHARDKLLPAEKDAEWVAKFLAFEQELMAIARPSYENLDALDGLLAEANRAMNDWTAPSGSELARVVALATRFENRTYFFDRLENPEWVSALADEGVFDDPPDREQADEAGYWRFPPWPEGRYLARMAPAAPDAVAAVLEKSRPSANPRVTAILLECLQALPPEQFRRLAPKTLEWITDRAAAEFMDHFDDQAASAVARLVRDGKIEQGLIAAKALLKLERRSTASDSSQAHEIPALPEPVGRLRDWEYDRTIATILPDLVDSAGLDGLRLFSSLLSVAIEYSRSEGELPDSDGHSCAWRPAIEDHPQNMDRDVRCVLVTAVRDAAVRLAVVSDENLQNVVQMLESATALHRRIALHVLAVVPGGAELAAERITNRTILNDHRLKHEYAELLRSRWVEAPPEVQRTFLDSVLAGPDLDDYQPEDETAAAECWMRDWLSIVADHLSGDDADRYRELVSKHGEADHPDFVSWTETWSGPTTPRTTEQLKELSPGEVIEYLDDWRPDAGAGRGFSPSMEGLGLTFSKAVSERAADFAAAANRIETLDPTYVRHFLSGLEAAVKAGTAIPWDQPMHLMASVLEHPFDHPEESPVFDRDSGWRWTRGRVASLIEQGVADRDNGIPFELRQAVWDVLEPLTRDPHPSPGDEASDSMDPLTRSINTNRGKAMHAVMAYALWCARELDAQGEDMSAGFDLMPEVRAVLEERLDPDTDPSLAVRAVYGKWLPWQILIDARWVSANISRILPPTPNQESLRDAAWGTYICWCPPFDTVYDVLGDEYEAAVERIPTGATVGFANDERVDAKLGEHLVTFYWRGVLQRSLLERWFELADDEIAGDVMEFLGQALRDTPEDIEPPVGERIQGLWDYRINVITSEPESHDNEAKAFALTFTSAKFDDEWSLAGLNATLRPGDRRWFGRDVIGRLAEMATTNPVEATRLTLKMLEDAANDWDHHSWRDPVRDVLTATSDAADEETRNHRASIIDHYIKHGDLDFRALTPTQP